MDSINLNQQISSSSSNDFIHDNDHVKVLNQLDEDARLAAQLAAQETSQDCNCASDAALAIMLQRQFDYAHDHELKKQEARLNGQSKVGVSLDNFRRTPRSKSLYEVDDDNDDPFYQSDEHDLENKFEKELVDWDAFEQRDFKRRTQMMGKMPYFMDKDGRMVTKHDIPTSSRKNVCRLMELKTDIQTGDAGRQKDDFKINNSVYNSLKVHSKKSSRRANQRLFDKKERDSATKLENIQAVKMSDATRVIMDGLLVAYKIDKLNGVIGHGKESTVLHATGLDHEDTPNQEVAIKIFKSDNNMAFKTRDTYNKSKCPTYKFDKPKSKNDSLNKWAERGFKNLKILRKAGINCPEAISLKKHVLVMTFLGSDAKPSPQLRQIKLEGEELLSAYKQIVEIMETMYQRCNLIHGDLSEYNLLWHNNEIYVIDVSQSMFISHPNANSFLYRDCKNITDFFKRTTLPQEYLMDVKTLFRKICGKDLSEYDVEFWSKMEDFPRNEKLMQKEEAASEHFQTADNFEHMLSSTRREPVKKDANNVEVLLTE